VLNQVLFKLGTNCFKHFLGHRGVAPQLLDEEGLANIALLYLTRQPRVFDDEVFFGIRLASKVFLTQRAPETRTGNNKNLCMYLLQCEHVQMTS
jgi:hypothetical protein